MHRLIELRPQFFSSYVATASRTLSSKVGCMFFFLSGETSVPEKTFKKMWSQKKMLHIWRILWLHPGRLTWNLRIHPIEKEHHLNQTIIFRFYVNLRGCIWILQVIFSSHPCVWWSETRVLEGKPSDRFWAPFRLTQWMSPGLSIALQYQDVWRLHWDLNLTAIFRSIFRSWQLLVLVLLYIYLYISIAYYISFQT